MRISGATSTPADHASTHEQGGGDSISAGNLKDVASETARVSAALDEIRQHLRIMTGANLAEDSKGALEEAAKLLRLVTGFTP